MSISHHRTSLPFWHMAVFFESSFLLFLQDSCGGEYCFKLSNYAAISYGGCPEILYVEFLLLII